MALEEERKTTALARECGNLKTELEAVGALPTPGQTLFLLLLLILLLVLLLFFLFFPPGCFFLCFFLCLCRGVPARLPSRVWYCCRFHLLSSVSRYLSVPLFVCLPVMLPPLPPPSRSPPPRFTFCQARQDITSAAEELAAVRLTKKEADEALLGKDRDNNKVSQSVGYR